jgi:hypothetical protein
MNETWSMITTITVSLCGSGGVVLWLLNHLSKKISDRDQTAKDIKEIKEDVKRLQSGLVMALENDVVIFHALKTHQINGDSEKQEEKMQGYFLSLFKEEK